MGVRFSIAIDAPPERVFEILADVPAHPAWANPKAKMSMEQTGGSGPGPSSTYRSRALFVGKPVSADISVTAYDPPRRFTIRSDQHQEGKEDVWYVNDYTLTPEDGGTPALEARDVQRERGDLLPRPPGDPLRPADVAAQPEADRGVRRLTRYQ